MSSAGALLTERNWDTTNQEYGLTLAYDPAKERKGYGATAHKQTVKADIPRPNMIGTSRIISPPFTARVTTPYAFQRPHAATASTTSSPAVSGNLDPSFVTTTHSEFQPQVGPFTVPYSYPGLSVIFPARPINSGGLRGGNYLEPEESPLKDMYLFNPDEISYSQHIPPNHITGLTKTKPFHTQLFQARQQALNNSQESKENASATHPVFQSNNNKTSLEGGPIHPVPSFDYVARNAAAAAAAAAAATNSANGVPALDFSRLNDSTSRAQTARPLHRNIPFRSVPAGLEEVVASDPLTASYQRGYFKQPEPYPPEKMFLYNPEEISFANGHTPEGGEYHTHGLRYQQGQQPKNVDLRAFPVGGRGSFTARARINGVDPHRIAYKPTPPPAPTGHHVVSGVKATAPTPPNYANLNNVAAGLFLTSRPAPAKGRDAAPLPATNAAVPPPVGSIPGAAPSNDVSAHIWTNATSLSAQHLKVVHPTRPVTDSYQRGYFNPPEKTGDFTLFNPNEISYFRGDAPPDVTGLALTRPTIPGRRYY